MLLALMLALNACTDSGDGDSGNSGNPSGKADSGNWNEMQWGQGRWR